MGQGDARSKTADGVSQSGIHPGIVRPSAITHPA